MTEGGSQVIPRRVCWLFPSYAQCHLLTNTLLLKFNYLQWNLQSFQHRERSAPGFSFCPFAYARNEIQSLGLKVDTSRYYLWTSCAGQHGDRQRVLQAAQHPPSHQHHRHLNLPKLLKMSHFPPRGGARTGSRRRRRSRRRRSARGRSPVPELPAEQSDILHGPVQVLPPAPTCQDRQRLDQVRRLAWDKWSNPDCE